MSPQSETLSERSDLSGPALRAFFAIAEKWGLSSAQERRLLGNPRASTFFRFKRDRSGELTRDQIERVSYVLGIYRALQTLFPNHARADAWVRTPSSDRCFGDRSPIDRMLKGSLADLAVVRQFLDAQCGGSE